ncbi:MAG: hypothetical protein PVF75_06810 [Granulosicoccaceae bacterium]
MKDVTQYYRIQPEQAGYMHFELDAYDFLDKLGEELELSDFGKPVQYAWKPVKGKFIPKSSGATIIPDISTWQTDLLILNQKAYDGLKDILEPYGELLPVEIGPDTYYLFNVLERLPDDVIDNENSEYEYYEEEAVGFRVLKFDENNIPQDKLLFCLHNDFAYNIYCDERLKNMINEKGLCGLYFNTILIDPYFKK